MIQPVSRELRFAGYALMAGAFVLGAIHIELTLSGNRSVLVHGPLLAGMMAFMVAAMLTAFSRLLSRCESLKKPPTNDCRRGLAAMIIAAF